MPQAGHHHHRSDLVRMAIEAMVERGLEPDFPAAVSAQLAAIAGPGRDDAPDIRDLTALCWCSIDNDDSRRCRSSSRAAPSIHWI